MESSDGKKVILTVKAADHAPRLRMAGQRTRNGTFTEPKQEYATFEDAAYVMRIVEACLKSDKEDCWVNL